MADGERPANIGAPPPARTPPPPGSAPVKNPISSMFATEQAIYGVLVVSGVIVASGGHGGTSVVVLVTVAVTVLVFWIAHVYAGTLARYGDAHGLREAIRRALHHSWGMLVAALVPSLVLALGALGVLEETVSLWVALWVGVGVLAVLGYGAVARRGAPVLVRVGAAAGTALLGVLMMALKAFVH